MLHPTRISGEYAAAGQRLLGFILWDAILGDLTDRREVRVLGGIWVPLPSTRVASDMRACCLLELQGRERRSGKKRREEKKRKEKAEDGRGVAALRGLSRAVIIGFEYSLGHQLRPRANNVSWRSRALPRSLERRAECKAVVAFFFLSFFLSFLQKEHSCFCTA